MSYLILLWHIGSPASFFTQSLKTLAIFFKQGVYTAPMKKSALTIFVTAAVTAVILFVLFIFLMPTLGPRFLHPMMADTMHENMPADMAAGMPAGMAAHMMNSAPPAELDTATERLTDNGLFNVSYSSDLDPVAINQMHSWTLLVTTPDGQPVEDAVILVDGGMPQHGHGLPTQPQVTEYLGNGRYRVEGLRFQMGGWWEVKFDITAAEQNDDITFNLALAG